MKIGGTLWEWYKKNYRELPWRLTRDPYHIWLSEVILQQTRVAQGLDYYNNFVQNYPDVHALAAADEQEVLKLWQGLGYYSRARNLHEAAKVVSGELEGIFPDSYEGLIGLKGVGAYTASAIASICYGKARAVVDGNVSRVIARVFGVEEAINSSRGEGIIRDLANEVMQEEGSGDPGTHNQAIMEFGALQCVPVSPKCHACPLENLCSARATDRVESLPVKQPKKKPVPRWMYFFVPIFNGTTILEKRGTQDIWRSLYQFPALESPEPLPDTELYNNQIIDVLQPDSSLSILGEPSPPYRHALSHRTIHALFIPVSLSSMPSSLPPGWVTVKLDELDKFPVPRLMERYLQSANFSYL